MSKNALIFTCFVFAMAATTANATALNATDSGWWDDTGFSGTASGLNFIAGKWEYNPALPPENDTTGRLPYQVWSRNFFVFDLENVGPVTSATLRLDANWVFGNGNYTLWDVNVDPTVDVSRHSINGLRLDIFADLGGGTTYGTTAMTGNFFGAPATTIDIELNAAAIAELNSFASCSEPNPPDSRQCRWAIGGDYVTDVPFENGNGHSIEFAFGDTGAVPSTYRYMRQLIINEGTPVPEPATTTLLALGLLGVGFARKRRTH
jgi:hypothetical protein